MLAILTSGARSVRMYRLETSANPDRPADDLAHTRGFSLQRTNSSNASGTSGLFRSTILTILHVQMLQLSSQSASSSRLYFVALVDLFLTSPPLKKNKNGIGVMTQAIKASSNPAYWKPMLCCSTIVRDLRLSQEWARYSRTFGSPREVPRRLPVICECKKDQYRTRRLSGRYLA